MLPRPPRMEAVIPFMTRSFSWGYSRNFMPHSTPALAASIPEMKKVSAMTKDTLMPMSLAVSLSMDRARMEMPMRVL